MIPVEVEMRTPTPPAGREETEGTQSPQQQPKKAPVKRKRNKGKKSSLASNNKKMITQMQMECNLCPFETEVRSSLQMHYVDEHSKEDLVDTLIAVTYPDVEDDPNDPNLMGQSKRGGSSAKRLDTIVHSCPICQKNICGKNNLEKHLVRHSPQKPFKCGECQKTFSAKRDLNLHEMRHHSQERPHVCPTCNKGFVDKAYLKKHITFHDNSRCYTCELCGKQFNNVLGLQKHCKTHSQERPFMCEKCSKCFRVKYDLTVHKRNVHKENCQNANEAIELLNDANLTAVCAISSSVCTTLTTECTPVL